MIIWNIEYRPYSSIMSYSIMWEGGKFILRWTNQEGKIGDSAHQTFLDENGPKETIRSILLR